MLWYQAAVLLLISLATVSVLAEDNVGSSCQACSFGPAAAAGGHSMGCCQERTDITSMLQVYAVADPSDKSLANVTEIAPGVLMPKVLLGMGGRLYAPLKTDGSGREAHNRAQAMAEKWLSVGGRGFDTAQAYDDEIQAGNALRLSTLPRADVFVLTKLILPAFPIPGAVTQQAMTALRKLGVDYIDLMLIHLPGDDWTTKMAWRELEQLVSAGRLRSIGVSNFDVRQMQAVLDIAQVPIALNQRHMSVMDQHDDEALNFCLSHGITYQAYSPLGDATWLRTGDKVIRRIAKAHEKSPVQVALRWVLQRGATVTVQSESREHQLEDLDIFDWSLTPEDMQVLDSHNHNLYAA